MTPEAKAREIVDWFGEQVSLDTARELYGKKPLAACIDQALRDVERETLERAAAKARAVFDANVGRGGTIAAVYTDCSAHIEQSIRSLIKEPTSGGHDG